MISVFAYGIIQYYSPYIAGLAVGVTSSFIVFKIYLKLHPSHIEKTVTPSNQFESNKIVEIQAVKEYQPLEKFEVSAFYCIRSTINNFSLILNTTVLQTNLHQL